MSTLLETLYSQNHWLADGSQTVWDFTFAGPSSSLKYIARSHVKAYWDDGSGNRTYYTFADPADWLGDYQVQTIPAPPAGKLFVIYRETPRDKPIVDYADGAAVSEPSLDTSNKQAVFLAQESLDSLGLNDDLGFKALKQIPYTGASELNIVDNGRAHYKEDATGVTVVDDDLPVTYLTTIINNSDDPLTVTFDGAVGHQQGDVPVSGVANFNILPRNAVGMNKVSTGHWFFNGYIE